VEQPENCHVVFVKSIEFQSEDLDSDPSNFPNMNNDPFTPAARLEPTAPLPSTGAASSSLSTKPLAPPTPSLVELPTCPVCLERMDETTGLLTILCQHVFHCACLEKWRGSGCPVCRYTQDGPIKGRGQAGGEDDCSVCGTTANLWICLICGNIGCGRYDLAHAFAHWEATGHSYAMDIATQHVWDYDGDGYVHRLIQTKADGKLVDLPAAYSSRSDANALTGYGPDTVPREKLDAMGSEYTYLLTSQLDSQRLYFEEQVQRAVDKAATAASEASAAASAASKLAADAEIMRKERDQDRIAMASLEKDLERAVARAEKANDLSRRLGKDWREEKTMNEALMKRIEHLDARVQELTTREQSLEAEKRDLEEQNRDLSFFISGGEKLQAAGLGDDVQQGYVEVPQAPEASGKKRKGKKK
jgi:BRCA1-associated protein